MDDKLDRKPPITPHVYYPAYPCFDEDRDEINLLDMFFVLVKYKVMIITIVIITGAAAVIISLLMPNIYRSEATIGLRPSDKESAISLPRALGGLGAMVAADFGLGSGSSDLEKLETLLKSRALSSRVINKYDLMPLIFPDEWDKDKKTWIIKGSKDKPPTLQDGLKVVQKELLKVNKDNKNKTIVFGFHYPEPSTAKKIADYYLTELSDTLREEVLKDSTENQRFFNEQLKKTSDALLKEKIYNFLVREIEKETFALAQKYYGFMVLDPPIAPDLDKEVKPKRALICIISVLAAFLVVVLLSFILESISKIKSEEPERYKALRDGYLFRKRRPKL